MQTPLILTFSPEGRRNFSWKKRFLTPFRLTTIVVTPAKAGVPQHSEPLDPHPRLKIAGAGSARE